MIIAKKLNRVLATVFTAEHLEWLDKLGIDKYKIASVTSSFKTKSPEDDRPYVEIIERKKKPIYPWLSES